jgi:hypothetical protein
MKKPKKKYRTTKDIVIPAGTEVNIDPPHRVDHFTTHASVLTAVTKDITSEWYMDLEEAIETGLVEEVTT